MIIVKLGIMQPYFLPYIGYWQLMNAVDQYVIADDFNYSKRGWIKRNRILIQGKAQYYGIEIKEASQNKLINETYVLTNEKIRKKLLLKMEHSYKKAPYYQEVYPLLETILCTEETNLALFLEHSIKVIARYLDIHTKFILSSELKKDKTLKCQDMVISICEMLHATEYYNAIGGTELYSFEEFKKHNIKLAFVKTEPIIYKQFNNEFIPNLSIIDVLMFNERNQVRTYLNNYVLIEE